MDKPVAATRTLTVSPSAVRRFYDFFDARRKRDEPFDEGDMQNIHAWMQSVTEWIEREEERRRGF